MSALVEIQGPMLGQSAVCDQVLRSLPEWFGVEQSIQEYVAAVESLPTFVARHSDDAIGFLSLKCHFSCTAEAYVLGVRAQWHRRGVGRQLFDAAKVWLISKDVRLLHVKTVAETQPEAPYAATRRFYETIGFLPVEIFPTLWNPRNPCLLLVMPLAAPGAMPHV